MSGLVALREVLGERLERNRPIGPLTTYRVGGGARWFVTVESIDELVAVARHRDDLPVLVLGRGSNLLVCDAGFDGVVVRLGERFASVDIPAVGTGPDAVAVSAGGAATLPAVARRTVAAGLTGFEWAVGVPGSVGGAVRMNAGGHGADMAASLLGIRLIDLATGDDVEMPASDVDLAYRHSGVRPHQVVVRADLGLAPGDRTTGEAELADIVRWRREHQPGGQNAGSVFANPAGDSAGRLIDAAGGRGMRVGTAQVSTKHANFIQVDADGSADDVYGLMVRVAERVEASSGVSLAPETRLVGFDPFPGGARVPGTA